MSKIATHRNRRVSTDNMSFGAKVKDYVRSIGTALIFALLIRQFIIQAFHIPTGSMEKTLLVGDFLFVNKFWYGAKTPERIRIPFINKTLIDGPLPVLKLPAISQPKQGDIIVFEFPVDRNQDYIKRCVAVAGDIVEMREGKLFVNDKMYEENLNHPDADTEWYTGDTHRIPHTNHEMHNANRRGNKTFGPFKVPDGKIFMMGDNRYNSADSRYWGPLDVDLVKGKALFIYWSWDKDKFRPRLSRIGDLIK